MLIGLLAVVVLFLGWQFYFNPLNEKLNESLEERERTESELQRMQDKIAKVPMKTTEYEEVWMEKEEELTGMLPPLVELPMVTRAMDEHIKEVPVEFEDLRLDEYDWDAETGLAFIDEDDEDDVAEKLVSIPGSMDVSGISGKAADANEELLEALATLEDFPHLTLINSISWDKDEQDQDVDFDIYFMED